MRIIDAASSSDEQRRFAAMAVGLVLAVVSAMAPGISSKQALAATEGNAATYWNDVAQRATVIGRPPAGAFVLQGIVNVAIYDAAIAIEGGYDPFIARPVVPEGASAATAVAAAARGVLVIRVPGQVSLIDSSYASFLATIPDGAAKTNGIFVGEQVAQAVLAWRADDGFDRVVQYIQPTPGPGVFEPVAPTTPVDVKLTQVRPLTYSSNSEFRPDGPNPLTSAEYAKDFNEVKALGRKDSTVRTPEQTQTAFFWSENSAIQYPRVLRRLAIERGLGLVETARMLALVQVASADALIACFDAKYHYMFWRPVHAIQRADTDGNSATEPDTSWQALLTVNHPEYPSAHGCLTAAVTDGLAAFFGTDKVTISIDSTVTGTTRSYDHFNQIAREVWDARVWAGLHFRNSILEGAQIGRKVARHVSESYFLPTTA